MKKFFNDIRLEIVSRIGLVSYKNYYPIFDAIYTENPEWDSKNYKDEFINKFMILFHKYIVEPSKFNWND